MTKWPEVFATSDQTALTMAKLFVEQIVGCHGVPAQVVSDCGVAFLSHLLTEICMLLGVEQVDSSLSKNQVPKVKLPMMSHEQGLVTNECIVTYTN